MANVLGVLFQNIADAIREKTGGTEKLAPNEFAHEIASIVVDSSEDMETINGLLDEINGEIISGKRVTFVGADGTVLCEVVVVPGNDCENPVTTGLISKPTKESTESIVYTFSGWSLTDGGSADTENALKNVTEDRTVYAAFTSSARRYSVYFYDGDTLLKSVRVAYGESAFYYPEKENYIFTGWEPSCENIVADTYCYAQWKLSDKLKDYSWTDIAAISESGDAPNRFLVGDTKTFTMTIDSTAHTLTARLIGFDHDDLADGTGKAGMTFEIMDMTKTGKTTAIIGNYETSSAWTDFDQSAQDCLEDELKPLVKQVSKKCYYPSGDTTYMLDAYMWRFALSEMDFHSQSAFPVPDEGEPYKYFEGEDKFATSSNTLNPAYEEMIRYGADGSAVIWGTRTLDDSYPYLIWRTGAACTYGATAYPFILGFCI